MPQIPWYLPFWIFLFYPLEHFPANFSDMTLHKDSANAYKYMYSSRGIFYDSTCPQINISFSLYREFKLKFIRCNYTDISCYEGVFAKNTSLGTKFPLPSGSGNLSPSTCIFRKYPSIICYICSKYHGREGKKVISF